MAGDTAQVIDLIDCHVHMSPMSPVLIDMGIYIKTRETRRTRKTPAYMEMPVIGDTRHGHVLRI